MLTFFDFQNRLLLSLEKVGFSTQWIGLRQVKGNPPSGRGNLLLSAPWMQLEAFLRGRSLKRLNWRRIPA
jgi:hypothetical protein